MIANWQHVVQKLKKYPEFQTIPGIEGLYDSINPTNKNVLDTLEAQPHTEAERDALRFLPRYIRGLEKSKLIHAVLKVHNSR